MENKEIYIDGVGESGCKYFRKDDPCKNTCQYFCTPCEWVGIQNCMYKYAKRKEQECEELNNDNHTLLVTRQKLLNDLWIAEESLKDFKEICDKQCEQLEAYKMEAEEGKEINAELKAENESWQKEYWKLEQGNDFLAEKNSELKGCLTEIKEIAEKIANYYDGDEYELMRKDAEQILQKISEVE
jgi:hypothetical protein